MVVVLAVVVVVVVIVVVLLIVVVSVVILGLEFVFCCCLVDTQIYSHSQAIRQLMKKLKTLFSPASLVTDFPMMYAHSTRHRMRDS